MDDKARDADLNTAMALTQRLLESEGEDSVRLPVVRRVSFGERLRYLAWKLGGRKHDGLRSKGRIERLLENYELELERLRQGHKRALAAERALALAEAEVASQSLRQDLERERQRVAQLEVLTKELERVFRAEMEKAKASGNAQAQPVLDAAHDRITALEDELSALEVRHHRQLEATTRQAEERIQAALADQAKEIEAMRLAHDAAMAVQRTRHAEELAELRTSGDWSQGDLRRQVTDLRLRLAQNDESHAEELDDLRRQHKAELSDWLVRFQQAQQRLEIRHAGEQAGSLQAQGQALRDAQARVTQLQAQLEQARREILLTEDRLAGATRHEAQLAAGLEHERQRADAAETRLQSLVVDLETAERIAADRIARLQIDLATERQALREQSERMQHLREELRRRHEPGQPAAEGDLEALRAEHNLELARLRLESSRRVADLERQLAQAQARAPDLDPPMDAEIISLDDARPRVDWEARALDALERLQRAEADARMAADRIAILEDALAAARARPSGGFGVPSLVVDNRFREVKLALLRAFHPDQGGRDDPGKAAMFQDFWPELERIERNET